MTANDCFELGFILRPHGLRGEVQLVLDVDEPQSYKDLATIYIQAKAGLVPYGISIEHLNGSKAIAKLEGVATQEQAQALKGRAVWLPLQDLPALDGDQFYYHEITGFTVHDQTTGEDVGLVTDVYELPQQDTLAVNANGAEVLIPLVDDFIVGVDKAAKRIIMKLPEGLVAAFTTPGKEVPDDGDEINE